MKDYIDYDEEVDIDEEDLENGRDVEGDEFYNMKPVNKNKNVKTKKFDENNFDVKVAKSIATIHVKANRKTVNDKFSRWVNKNLNHLQALYSMSDLKCSPEQFYTYIYENSK